MRGYGVTKAKSPNTTTAHGYVSRESVEIGRRKSSEDRKTARAFEKAHPELVKKPKEHGVVRNDAKSSHSAKRKPMPTPNLSSIFRAGGTDDQ